MGLMHIENLSDKIVGNDSRKARRVVDIVYDLPEKNHFLIMENVLKGDRQIYPPKFLGPFPTVIVEAVKEEYRNPYKHINQSFLFGAMRGLYENECRRDRALSD